MSSKLLDSAEGNSLSATSTAQSWLISTSLTVNIN